VKIHNEKILVVDNEDFIKRFLKKRLTNLGFNIISTNSVKQALFLFNNEKPCLVIIDIMLPTLDSSELCQKIRENSQVPILILTSQDSISSRVKGFKLGADDYIIKPFFPKELEVRVKSLVRRSYLQSKDFSKKKRHNFYINNLFIDMNNKLIIKNNHKTKLTNIEYCILELLITNPGNNLSRSTILYKVWGYTPERYVDERIVDVHISRLRSKIEQDPTNPDLIITVRGLGYMFKNIK